VTEPRALSRLLDAGECVEREDAWAEFVAAYSGILLHTCRKVAKDRDAAMDGYAYVLQALHEDSCRRLRAYTPDGRTQFTTWLVVVARRLLVDHYRRRYGRARSDDQTRRADHAARRRLEELVAGEIDPDLLTASTTHGADLGLRRRELTETLRTALDELDPSDRLLLALRFDDERPVREIATLLQLPSVFHVYRRLGIVLTALRRALVRRGVEGSEP
jgi:RNA polymerase sigma factor (sigma-70 family)